MSNALLFDHLFHNTKSIGFISFSLIMLPTTGLLIAGILNAGIPGMEIAIALHELSAFLSYITIGIHVAASLYSRYKGEGVWNAMVPVWREDSKKNTKLVSRLEVLENKIYDEIEDRFIK